jgi:hypothetical protein
LECSQQEWFSQKLLTCQASVRNGLGRQWPAQKQSMDCLNDLFLL